MSSSRGALLKRPKYLGDGSGESGRQRLVAALAKAEKQLLAARDPHGVWRGRLSTSALSTATAAFALIEIGAGRRAAGSGGDLAPLKRLARGGLEWLARHANTDGGWGDTPQSRSNLSTTLLCWAALEAGVRTFSGPDFSTALARARVWITKRAGGLDRETLRRAIESLYGDDKTFSIPILTLCTLAGVLGPRHEAFAGMTPLPFELAALPQSWFRFVGLPVVSYALPALIAVGQVQHAHAPTANPLVRAVRERAVGSTLRRLESIQPSSGGFLEAIPLTSFVAMSLAAAGRVDHPVVDRALAFLAGSVRADGSWPIDIDLATWVTTLAVQALDTETVPPTERDRILEWLLAQQHHRPHPFTGAAPGGWAWTDLPGGVPDADDTPGALLALDRLDPGDDLRILTAAEAGLDWLLGLQNRDGGIPTFCRGWGRLPFDRSSPDLTAHTLRAFSVWGDRVSPGLRRRLDRAERGLVTYLQRQQRQEGSWVPLWFGHEAAPGLENPTYGTARCLRALEVVARRRPNVLAEERRRAESWLISAQGEDGGWGGGPGIPPSIEETALAVEALAASTHPLTHRARWRGACFLAAKIEEGGLDHPTPIGFYFANLWYSEALYPAVFAIPALRRALELGETAVT